jgi:hypothetical protein
MASMSLSLGSVHVHEIQAKISFTCHKTKVLLLRPRGQTSTDNVASK